MGGDISIGVYEGKFHIFVSVCEYECASSTIRSLYICDRRKKETSPKFYIHQSIIVSE